MKHPACSRILAILLFAIPGKLVQAQAAFTEKVEKASQKIEKGIKKNNTDTLAGGYFDLAETYFRNGDMEKSELYYKKSKDLYQKLNDADGIAKSSRALAKVQEELHKNKEAIGNYTVAQQSNLKTGDANANALNGNDISRLSHTNSIPVQEKLLQDNITLGLKNNDSNEIAVNYGRMAQVKLQNNGYKGALSDLSNAYKFSIGNPGQAQRYNQLMADTYIQGKDFTNAIETKKVILNEPFVQSSSKVRATEITSLADIYIQKKEEDTAIRLLNESYELSVRNGHTLEAKKCIEKLDSIFQATGKKEKSLQLYKMFLQQLPAIVGKDSSLTDNRIIAETEEKLKKLETEKTLKDELIQEKNMVNYWLIGSLIALVIFSAVILVIVKKLQTKNKKIALQSLRREMNPHFIFNSLNSINQFIANNNELEANQYLTKFSTLMRRVMENSKEDFVPFAKEIELLKTYLELEKSRFPDKFDFDIYIDDSLYADENLFIPGMLVQPYLENSIWHGLRYTAESGTLKLSFTKEREQMLIVIEDNGIGIAASKQSKTANQQKHSGRGISNTEERIAILNQLYRQDITCIVADKPSPDHGVKVVLRIPLLKNIRNEN